jgi:hypothetical protein
MNRNIFISYNHSKDTNESVKEISNKFRDMGLKVWLDQTDIKAGESLSKAISSGLDESSHMIFIVSKNDKNSEWAHKELNTAFSKNKKIIPILINNATSDDLPEQLKDYYAIDITNNPKSINKVYEAIDRDRSPWNKLKEYIVND